MTPAQYHRGQIYIDTPSGSRAGSLADSDAEAAKWEGLVDEVGIHWLSITGKDDSWAERARALVRERLGSPGEKVRPTDGYRDAVGWRNGLRVQSDHRSSGGHVSIPGGACEELGPDNLVALGRDLMFGGRCRRIDLFRDLRRREDDPSPVSFLDDVVRAVDAGQLCRVRAPGPGWHEYPDGEKVPSGQYLGSSKSHRFVRVYDKGLERGGKPGRHIRFEGQFRDEPAEEAGAAVLASAEWCKRAAERLVGIIDFRVVTGAASLGRRDRPPFWDRFCGSINGVRVSCYRGPTRLDRALAALNAQYGPLLVAAARVAGCTLAEVAEYVFAGARVANRHDQRSDVRELARRLLRTQDRSCAEGTAACAR